LDNNFGANSTAEPDFADISGANTNFYRTSDGYVWKYMYSVSSAQVNKFATDTYFPVIANSEVTTQALVGAIDIIKIETAGLRYNNYLTGIFAASECRINDDLTYKISNTVASTVNGYYTGCSLYLASGPGSGQQVLIDNYFSNANGNFAIIKDAFAIQPQNGTAYEIYPSVTIHGSASETTNAVARALINSTSGNSLYRIEMFERGENYNYITANVVANDVVGVLQDAVLRAIYSPAGGHGYDPGAELLAGSAEISLKFSNSESNTILTTNIFQQVGVIKNPLFANVQLNLGAINGLFLTNEQVLKINPLQICDSATINTTSAQVTAANGQFTKRLAVNDYVYLTDANNTFNQLGVVNNVINSTAFNLTVNGFVSCTVVDVLTANILAMAYVRDLVSTSLLYVTNAAGEMISNDFIIGLKSGATATINTVMRNDVTKNYETFIQLYKYLGTLEFNNFTENEIVQQNTSANALLHCANVDANDVLTMYTSNQVGMFDINTEVIGNTSGAIALLTEILLPELVYNTGDIIYLENLDAITRQTDQSETFQIVFKF
jgi:hypothetical protein